MKGNIMIKNYRISNCNNCARKTYQINGMCSGCGQLSEKNIDRIKANLISLLNQVD